MREFLSELAWKSDILESVAIKCTITVSVYIQWIQRMPFG
jgi:hypothetical protein